MQVQQADEGSITPVELQAELDTLRSLRRRSISQPSEGIDPDLPPSPSKYSHGSPPGSPKQLHAVPGPSDTNAAAFAGPSGSSSSGSGLGRNSAPLHLSSDIAEEEEEETEDQPLADNLSELFWLPARLHPEIAPQEFRNFIRDQTRPENLLRRSGSQLGRRKSMLSRQYQPSDTETESTSMFASDVDSTPSTSPSMSRRPSRAGSFRRSTGLERLTLADLQKLETIARQAAEEGQTGDEGEAQLKRLVRRSLSLNPAAILGAADQLRDDDSYVEDDTDSPLIVPPPGSILRRSARTKIRKNSLLGDGGGHRFGPSRRGTKLQDSPTDDDSSRSLTGQRQTSISSLTSVEEDRSTSHGERPTSAELRRRSPRSPNSPGPSQYTSEPIPMQYMPPTGINLAERMEAADLGPQENDQMTMSPGRAGADIPQNDRISPPSLQWATLSGSDEGASKAAQATGSLRTTKRIGAQVQPSPEFQPRTSSAAGKALSPPLANPLQLPTSPEASKLQLFEEMHTLPDSRPALPRKPSVELRQTGLQSSAPIIDKQPTATPPQTRSRTQAAFQQETPKPQQASAPSQIPRKTQASPVHAPKEKEKKSTWAKLGLSRSTKEEADIDDAASIASTSSGGSGTFGRKGKKTKKDKLPTEIGPEKKQQPVNNVVLDKDKSDKQEGPGSFFGGLFGKKKAEQNEQAKKEGTTTPTQMQMPTPPPTASGMLTPDGKYINFYRLPIHIERAVYRLSHIKLANPRRPLYEQVLISNLMFWYLGVINKPVAPPQMQQRPPPPQQQQQQLSSGPAYNPRGSETPSEVGSPAAAPSSRPPLTREKSSASAVPTLSTPEDPDDIDHIESNSAGGRRPASHPPIIVRSPPREAADPDSNLRLRPQTMPASQNNATYSQSASPPDTGSQPYRYQDYVATPTALFNGHQKVNGRPDVGLEDGIPNTWQDVSVTPQELRKSRRFSSESAEADEVRYDSRRSTGEMDTYDIISAYADEERRKSLLAQQSSPREDKPERPTSLPDVAAAHRNGHSSTVTEERVHGHHSKPGHRATPPRQSSMSATSSRTSPHQHTVNLPGSSRHATRSPPPPHSHSPHTLHTQS